MYTTSHAKLLDRKNADRKASLQWLFTDVVNDVRRTHISDKRDVGVSLQNMKTNKPGGPGSNKDSHKGDSLPGFFALDLFTGGLLSFAFHGVNIASVVQTVDEVWLDRAKAKPDAQPEPSYFSY